MPKGPLSWHALLPGASFRAKSSRGVAQGGSLLPPGVPLGFALFISSPRLFCVIHFGFALFVLPLNVREMTDFLVLRFSERETGPSTRRNYGKSEKPCIYLAFEGKMNYGNPMPITEKSLAREMPGGQLRKTPSPAPGILLAPGEISGSPPAYLHS